MKSPERINIDRTIYFDHQTTAPLDPRVRAATARYLDWDLGIPTSNHVLGRSAAYALDVARQRIGRLIGAEPGSRIVFTSGRRESLEIALAHSATFATSERDHVIAGAVEWVLAPERCQPVAARKLSVTAIPADDTGRFAARTVLAAVTERSFLVSMPLAHDELGTVQDIAALARAAHASDLLMHVDASRGVGYVSFDVAEMSVDLVSLDAHRLYGPKGIGALYVSRRLVDAGWGTDALWSVSETENVPAIVGFGAAAEILLREANREATRIIALAERLERTLREAGAVLMSLGAAAPCVPAYLDLCVPLLDEVALADIHAVIALGYRTVHRDEEHDGSSSSRAMTALRIGLGRFTSEEEVDSVAALIVRAIRDSAARQNATDREVAVVVNCEGVAVACSSQGYVQFCNITNTARFLTDLGEYAHDALCTLGCPARVSIVIPSYRSNHHLGQTLVSLLDQEVSLPGEIVVLINEPPDAEPAVRAANDATEAWLNNVIAGAPGAPERFSACDRDVRAALDRAGCRFRLHAVRVIVTGGIPAVYQTALSSFMRRARTFSESLGNDRARRLRALDELCDRTFILFCDDDIVVQSRDALERAYYDAVVNDRVVLGRWRGLENTASTDPVQHVALRLMSYFIDIKYDHDLNALPPKGLLLRHVLEAGGLTLNDGFGDQLYFAKLASSRRHHMMDVMTSIEEADYASNGRMLRDLRLYLGGEDNRALTIFHNLLRLSRGRARAGRYDANDIERIIAVVETRDPASIEQHLDALESKTGGLR